MQPNRTSVALYFLLVFALSVPFWALGIAYEVELLPGLPIGALIAFTPGIAAAAMTYRGGKLAAVRRLMRRSFDLDGTKDRRWLFVILLFNPIVAVAAFGIMRALGVAVPTAPLPPFTVVSLFAAFFIGALGEEIGWTGYATEPLLRRFGILKTGVLLGVVWVGFHVVVLSQADRPLEWIGWWALGTVSLRTIMVWLYVHAGASVFSAAVFHSMINLCWQLFPIQGSFYDPKVFSLTALALGILVAGAWRLMSRSHTVAA